LVLYSGIINFGFNTTRCNRAEAGSFDPEVLIKILTTPIHSCRSEGKFIENQVIINFKKAIPKNLKIFSKKYLDKICVV